MQTMHGIPTQVPLCHCNKIIRAWHGTQALLAYNHLIETTTTGDRLTILIIQTHSEEAALDSGCRTEPDGQHLFFFFLSSFYIYMEARDVWIMDTCPFFFDVMLLCWRRYLIEYGRFWLPPYIHSCDHTSPLSLPISCFCQFK